MMLDYSKIDSLISDGISIVSRYGIESFFGKVPSLSKDTMQYVVSVLDFLIKEKNKSEVDNK